MSLIDFSRLAFGYSDQFVITEASGALYEGNVVGLVGPNGEGKTTLIRLLLGELAPEQGTVQQARHARIAYVAQAAADEAATALYAYVRGGCADLVELEVQVDQLTARVSASPEDAQLARRLGEAQERFQALGGHRWDSDISRLLYGLSFSAADLAKPLGQLSGGQRQKAALARALLSSCNCLILDEPTNHLDLAAQEFFVSYVKSLPSSTAVLMVSHDRWLLDALCSQVWELDGGILYRYQGNYAKYVPQRDLRRAQMREAFVRQQAAISRTEDYIRRNIAGQNTRQAQGRRKLLGRMERLSAPERDPEMSFVLKPALRPGEQLLTTEDLAFSYGPAVGAPSTDADDYHDTYIQAGHHGLALNPPLERAKAAVAAPVALLSNVSFNLYRGERLGIIGANGCGKTTLLKLLAKQLPPLHGMVAWGSNAELGVFSQDSADLIDGHDLLAELRRVESGISDGHAREYLARFGFSGDDVFADTATLSGGERSRLSLAKIFRRRPNVLLLDEPTNHLDIYAREALEQFLEAYGGSIVMVTHDRALLERICDRLVVFEAAEGTPRATYFRGRYSDYRAWRELQHAEARPAATSYLAQERRRQISGELPSLEELSGLAKQARTSTSGYCAKQVEREERKANELLEAIAGLEVETAALAAEQHQADRAGRYEVLGALQEQIEQCNAEIEIKLAELADAERRAREWKKLGEAATG